MKPTDEQINAASGHASMLTLGIGKEHRIAYSRELIAHWESIRQPDDRQLVRTNHELAEQLAEVKRQRQQVNLSMTAVVSEKVTEIERLKAELAGIKADCRLAESHYEDAARDLKAAKERNSELVNVNCDLAMRIDPLKTELAELKALAPAPLAFPDPPHGWEWHNPENLTPEQVGIRDGWRLLCTEERTSSDLEYLNGTNNWSESRFSGLAGDNCATIRTKAPLPAPKPTAEETERAELIAAWEKHSDDAVDGTFFDDFSAGWKAARASKEGQQ